MLDKLYANIGGKLKGLAKCTFVVEVIASIIAYIALVDNKGFWVGLVVLIGGVLVSFVSTWFLYAFGELVFRVCSIDENLRVLSVSTHEQMNRDMREAEERVRKEAQERARKAAEEAAAKRKAQLDNIAQTTVKTVDIVGEEIAQTAVTVGHFVAGDYASHVSEKQNYPLNAGGYFNSPDERAKRKAEWDAEVQKRKEAEDRARQVVEERMRRKAEERARQNPQEN